MTREEAIKILQSDKPDNYSDFFQFAKDEYMAKLLAIKSLEAWGKVKEEMQEQHRIFANIPSISGILADAIEIVDKHLKEIEVSE